MCRELSYQTYHAFERGEKTPTSKIPGVVRRRPIFLRADLVIRAGVLSKVLRLGLVLEVRVHAPLRMILITHKTRTEYGHLRGSGTRKHPFVDLVGSSRCEILVYSKSCKCCCSFAIQTICCKIGRKEIDRARNSHCQENKENATQNGILP